MIRNTSYEVRPDKHTTQEIDLLKPELGVIVFDTSIGKNKYYNGVEWIPLGGSSTYDGGLIDLSNANVKNVDTQAYDILPIDTLNLINVMYNGDWTINLPDIDSVNEDFQVAVINKVNGDFTGSIVPYSNDLIDGLDHLKVYGVGLTNIKKIKINNEYKWFVFNKGSYNTVPLQGKTRRIDFTNESTLTIQHNLGFIPIVQVWVEDGQGGYVESNVDIDHDWDNMNSFTVHLLVSQNGKVIY